MNPQMVFLVERGGSVDIYSIVSFKLIYQGEAMMSEYFLAFYCETALH